MKWIFVLLTLIGCSHNKTTFESYPIKSNVSVIEKDGSIKNLGTTPLEIDNSKLFHSEMVQIVFSHKNYQDKNFVVARPENNTRMNISAKLKKSLSDESDFMKKVEKVSSQIAKIQNNINIKNFDSAESIVVKLIADFPELSVAYDLLANIHYLKNNKQQALYYYRKADSLNPNNQKRKRIMRKISGEF